MPAPVFMLDQVIGQLTRWDARWASPNIEYSFYSSRPAHTVGDSWWNGFTAFTAAQQNAVALAFSLIADIVPLNFTRIADDGSAPRGDDARITFARSTTFPAFATGVAYVEIAEDFDLGDAHSIDGSDTLFNINRWGNNLAMGARDFSVLLHEILHGLGLPHPGEYNRNPDEEITYAKHADYAQDTGQYTVMSYFSAAETGAMHGGLLASTPLLHDIAALQAIYGANTATRAGDTTYGFNSNAGRAALDFTQNQRPIVAIWDGGGIDTIDLSGFFTPSILDLRQGAFSSAGGLTLNIAVAFGAVIENGVGGQGADVITGNAADNRLDGGGGADRLIGGLGNDTYVLDDGADVYIEAAGEGDDTVVAAFDLTLGEAVENLILIGTALSGTGNTGANKLTGNANANVLDGGQGADVTVGGAGNDIYLVDHRGDAIVEVADDSGGVDEVRSTLSHALAEGVENLTLIGSAAANAVGNASANILTGNAAANILKGGAGADRMVGGAGDDIYIVDSAFDTVIELAGQGRDEVQTVVSWSLAGSEVEILTLLGGGAIDGTGNSLANTLTGNAARNRLDGGSGADVMAGGRGDDIYIVDNAADIVREAADGGARDLVQSSVSYRLTGDAAFVEQLTLTGAGALNATGNALDNVLTGNAGANGIYGGLGRDTLVGGAGADRFQFNSVAETAYAAYDRILDLEAADRIDLSRIDANTRVSGDQAFTVVAALTGVAGQLALLHSASTGNTVIVADVNGDGLADLRLWLAGDHRGYDNFIL